MAVLFSNKRNKWFITKVKDIEVSGVSQAEIARRIGVMPQYLTPILSGKRNASENIVLQLCKAFDISLNDLYSQIGVPVGLMSNKEIAEQDAEVKEGVVKVGSEPPPAVVKHPSYQRLLKKIQEQAEVMARYEGVPLIPIDAVAGYGEDNAAVQYEDCEIYRVPEFQRSGVEFVIRVSGSSMYPKCANGDILACKKITDILFFQWGKVYVIDSSQGQLVKRVFEHENPEMILLVSDNKEKYPSFAIPKSDIRSLSIVLGVIRME